MTSHLKRAGQKILVFLVSEANKLNARKFSGIPLNLCEVVFLAIQDV